MATVPYRNLQQIFNSVSVRCTFQKLRLMSNKAKDVNAFDDERVKLLLKKITGRNLDKIFMSRQECGVGLPSYKLMTDEEICKAEDEMETEAEKYLEMPAIMNERKDSENVLEERPDLQGYTECNMVFTDISQNTTNRDRRIVVRQTDGILREAYWEERDRMNFLFFQRDGQSYKLPSLLEDEHLKNAFERNGHVEVLDLVCVQCESDSADYIRVHEKTYEDLHRRQLYDLLRSTRHFGAMAYYFTKQKRITWLLVDMLKRDLISDACDLVKLFHILHPSSPSARKQFEGVELVKAYVMAEGPPTLLKFLEEEDEKVFNST